MPTSTDTDDRAKVVTLVQQKGGSGKSTLAVNLAAVSGQNRSMACVPGTTSSPPLSRSITSQAIHAATHVPGSTRR